MSSQTEDPATAGLTSEASRLGRPDAQLDGVAVTEAPAAGIAGSPVVASGQEMAPAKPASPTAEAWDPTELKPVDIVRRLDEYIIGQNAAKRAVAIALRNRVRRQKLPEEMRQEVLPKNILMIGPTGVGKTEIARRLARLTASPFIKVEATKFTEVGYVGRDVEAIVRDLLEQTITEVQNERIAEVEDRAREVAENRILDILADAEVARRGEGQESGALAGAGGAVPAAIADPGTPAPAASPERSDRASGHDERQRQRQRLRRRLAARLRAQQLEDTYIDVEVEEPYQPPFEGFAGTGMEEMGYSLSDFFSQMAPPRKRGKRMTVADARIALTQEETDRLIDMDRIYDDAIHDVEDDGIVFMDEVDKICGPASDHGPDVSGEGVQRDLLPLLEGSVIHTRYGSVRTDHILFIAAGAFNVSRPSDLIPEFQGRFPIRVELRALSQADLERILTEPNNALTKQYQALLGTEGVELVFADDGLAELAGQAFRVNEQDENIGARRLFTIMEKVLEDLSFSAEDFAGRRVVVDADMVRDRLKDLVRNDDARRYVL